MNEKPAGPSTTPGGGIRVSPAEREKRLVRVEDLYFRRLLPAHKVEERLAEEFDCARRTIRTYLRTIRQRARMRAESDPDPRVSREKLTEFIVDRMDQALELGKSAKKAGDLRTALAAEREGLRAANALADLHGLKVLRHELSGPNGTPLGITSENAWRQLAEALDRTAARTGSKPEPSQKPDAPAAPDGQ